jgi:hypothetical protein
LDTLDALERELSTFEAGGAGGRTGDCAKALAVTRLAIEGENERREGGMYVDRSSLRTESDE